MKLIALDPGGTTGWATCDYKQEPAGVDTDGTVLYENVLKFTSGQIGPGKHHRTLLALLEFQATNADYHVICESFEFRQRARDNLVLVSKEYIGIVELFHQTWTPTPVVVFQTAAMAKVFVTNDKIKSLNLWDWRAPHAMDAMRHLIYYLVHNTGARNTVLSKWK